MNPLGDAIRTSYIFSGLTTEQADKVAALAEQRVFEGGTQLVRQFAKDSDIMVLVEGRARVNTFSGHLIAELGVGSALGEMSLVDDKPRSATVVAMGHVVAAVVPRQPLWELMQSDAEIGRQVILNIARIMTERLRRANIELDEAGRTA